MENAKMKRKTKKDLQGNGLFWAVSAGLLLVIISCITLTVQARERKSDFDYDEAFYDELEDEYKDEISQVLNECGLYHSGINLTKITQADGSRKYDLRIYHARLEHMNSDRMTELQERLCAVVFPESSCEVRILLEIG